MEKLHPKNEEPPKLGDYSYTTLQLGVWRLLLHKGSDPGNTIFLGFWSLISSCWSEWAELRSGLPVVWRFLREIYTLAPGHIALHLLLIFGSSFEGTLMLHASSRLLRAVETSFAEGRPDITAILQAVTIRLICNVFGSTICWAKNRIDPILRRRVRDHFKEYIFREQLRLDLPTGTDKNNKVSLHRASDAYYYLEFLGEILQAGFRLISQVIFTISQPTGGITLTLLSLVAPFFAWRLNEDLWNQAYVIYASNFHYLRLHALRLFVSDEYREETISANIKPWIYAEYRKAREELGDISDRHPQSRSKYEGTPIVDIVARLSTDLPMFYWAASVIFQPANFSITSFAILQQHAEALRATIQGLLYQYSELSECVSNIGKLYQIKEVENKIVDGEAAYPNSTLSTEKGMEVEFKNVSFAYPGAKSNDSAIKDISFKIPAGHLVVIVGANGSGKSTLIKLVSRLYDVDSGEILIDGLPIKDYRLSDFRNAQALLTQDHTLYPLTLAENIGLGDPNRINDMARILQAVECGGASDVINKLTDGLQTTLSPVQTAEGYRLDKEEHKKLQSILEELEQQADVSGGEKQRLVAARTFMRFFSGKIRFAAADEPSSALDPKAEYRLFQRLRDSRDGKTLIFVTHRFGHLTKHADLVICMKDGEIVEAGTHKQLIARDGEYSELYNVQAQAFEDI